MPESLATKPLESQVDVLIVGAGPTGLLTALALTRAGVSTRVVDITIRTRNLREPDALDNQGKGDCPGQADGIHPHTLEVLQSYGIADRVFKEGTPGYAFVSWNPSSDGGIMRTALTPFIPIPTARYPFSVAFAQPRLEGCLRDGMKECGAEVEQGVTPIILEISDDKAILQSPTAYPVKVVLQRLKVGLSEVVDSAAASQVIGTESEVVRAKFVVGADGAHSWVRQALGIDMIGESTNSVWGVVDFVPETDFPDIRTFSTINSPHGSTVFVPREDGLVRVYVQLAEVDVDETGRLDKSKFTPDDIIKVAQKLFHPYKLVPKVIDWWTLYVVGQRVASSYSVKNRVLIAGDACHTHSPKGGQGMNAGLGDAHNLAWKLAYVLRQWAPVSFLDTYDAERRKFAEELTDFDKYCVKMFATKVKADDDETEGVTRGELATAYATRAGFLSGIGVQYQPSTIINISNPSLASNLVIGERLPPGVVLRVASFCPLELHDVLPSDTKFKILILPGDINDPKQKAKLDAIAARLDQPEGFLKRFTPPDAPEDAVFDIITISRTEKTAISTQMIPPRLLSHWEKAYIDAESFCGRVGGKLYAAYGVSNDGAIIVCRPDGYIGMIAALDGVDAVGAYFSGFLCARPDA